jgi:hypothetical protein
MMDNLVSSDLRGVKEAKNELCCPECVARRDNDGGTGGYRRRSDTLRDWSMVKTNWVG